MNEKLMDRSSDDERTSIVLPLKKRDLGNFISSLLGQQQTIERDFEVKFDIDHSWVVNLHELLDQRIKQQADATLMSFHFVVYFANGLRRTLTSVEALKSYAETKKEIPVGIKIIWVYLVPFPGRDHPEKQEISFSAQIHSKERNSESTVKNRFRFESTILESVIGESERSSISYNIEHTERTWGDDLEVIFSNQVDEVVRGNEIKDSLFNLSRLVLALALLLFSLIYPFYTIFTAAEVSSNDIQSIVAQYKAVDTNSTPTLESIEIKLDFISSMIAARSNFNNGFDYTLLIFMFGPAISLVVLRLTRKGTSSFLVFSRESEKDRKKKLKKENRSYLIVGGSYLLAIIASIIANYGYAWLSS